MSGNTTGKCLYLASSCTHSHGPNNKAIVEMDETVLHNV